MFIQAVGNPIFSKVRQFNGELNSGWRLVEFLNSRFLHQCQVYGRVLCSIMKCLSHTSEVMVNFTSEYVMYRGLCLYLLSCKEIFYNVVINHLDQQLNLDSFTLI